MDSMTGLIVVAVLSGMGAGGVAIGVWRDR
jgi:small-conductance mechanosensitive channel